MWRIYWVGLGKAAEGECGGIIGYVLVTLLSVRIEGFLGRKVKVLRMSIRRGYLL